MKKFYCLQVTFFDDNDEPSIAQILKAKKAFKQPKNTFKIIRHEKVFNIWRDCDTQFKNIICGMEECLYKFKDIYALGGFDNEVAA